MSSVRGYQTASGGTSEEADILPFGAKTGCEQSQQTRCLLDHLVGAIEHDDDNLYMLKMRLERIGDFEVHAAENW